MRARISRQAMRGMSLIELMIVVAIVAILGSIATSAYRKYMMRSNRSDGTTQLLRLQAAEEKFFLQNNTYTANMGVDGLALTTGTGTTTMTTPAGYYSIAIAAGQSGTLATSYTATATPQGGQVKDTACPTFTIDDQGTHGPSATAVACWK